MQLTVCLYLHLQQKIKHSCKYTIPMDRTVPFFANHWWKAAREVETKSAQDDGINLSNWNHGRQLMTAKLAPKNTGIYTLGSIQRTEGSSHHPNK